jgi:DGQHR domain-containing protein
LILGQYHVTPAFKAADDEIDKLLQDFDEKYQEACEANDDPRRRALAAELDEINDKIDVCSGTLWIPYGVRLEVTDGQHRILTVLNRIKKGDPALTHPSQGIPAMVMIEPRRPKRQQDFVDLGQTAPIQQTIKIHMDYRQTVTKLVKEMVESVPVFADQFIELRRPSIRKNSTNLYSLSNLKTAVQAMLLGNTRLGAADAQRRLSEKLDGAGYDRLRDIVVNFFSRLSEEVPCFRQVLAEPDSTDYVRVREEYMCLNSGGPVSRAAAMLLSWAGPSSRRSVACGSPSAIWSDSRLWKGWREGYQSAALMPPPPGPGSRTGHWSGR